MRGTGSACSVRYTYPYLGGAPVPHPAGVAGEVVLMFVFFGFAVYDLQIAHCFGLGATFLGAGFTVFGIGGWTKVGIPLPGGLAIVITAAPGVGLIVVSLALVAFHTLAC